MTTTDIDFNLTATSNPTSFINLTDTPDTYTGQTNKIVRVKSTEDGLEFHTLVKSDITLGNVDNTSDVNKPISTATQTALNLKATTTDLSTHTSDLSNPHQVTKTQVGLSDVTNFDTTNPSNITQDSTHRFVSDIEKSTWNGKQDALGYTAENNSNKVTTLSGSSTDTQYPTAKLVYDQLSGKQATGSYEVTTNKEISTLDTSTSKYPCNNVVKSAVDLKVTANTTISGATKTKITYDSKGLVTSGTDASTADISDSTDKRYITDTQRTVLSNTSGTNTGDETTSTIKSKLSITTLSGSNTGDQDLSGYVTLSQSTPQTIGTTTSRLSKLWTEDLTVTNTINGSITGNAVTVSTNANLTGPVTSVGNATTIEPIVPASGTGTTTGFTITLTSTETQAVGDAVMIDSNGKAHLAKADAIANAGCVLLAAHTVTGSASNTYLLPNGTMRLSSSPSWVKGSIVYLSTTGTTGNTLTTTPPSGSNNVIQPLGIALTTDTILFMPNLTQVEHT